MAKYCTLAAGQVVLTSAGWAALRSHVFGEVPAGGKAGVTNALNQGVLSRTEVGIAVTALGREVATRVWGGGDQRAKESNS